MHKSSTSTNEDSKRLSQTSSVRRVIFPCLHSAERKRNNNNIVADMVPFSSSTVNDESEGSSHVVQQQNAKNTAPGPKDTFEIQKNNNENHPTTTTSSTMAVATTNKRPSILRSSRFSIDRSSSPNNDPSVDASSSLDSVPSLTPSFTSISTSPSMDCITTSPLPAMPRRSVLPPRCISEPTMSRQPMLQFDPHIFVREFQRTPEEHRSTWFSPTELSTFKSASLDLVHTSSNCNKPILFSHPSLSATADHDDDEQFPQRILIIDPLDVSAAVVARGVRQLFPSASIIETRRRIDHETTHTVSCWDIIVCAERWRPCWYNRSSNGSNRNTGSALVRAWKPQRPSVVWIGTSAHPEDEAVLQAAGVDLFWNLPLQLDDTVDALRETILRLIRQKQGRTMDDD